MTIGFRKGQIMIFIRAHKKKTKNQFLNKVSYVVCNKQKKNYNSLNKKKT